MKTLLLLLLLAAPLTAQRQCNGGEGSFHCWVTWQAGNPWRNHPQAHAIGGMAMDLAVRLPLFNDAIRKHTLARLAAVAVIQSGWEFWQLKETEGYPIQYAALDVAAAVAGAALLELVLHHD